MTDELKDVGVEVPIETQWQEYLRWARRFAMWEGFDETERNYKLKIGDRLVESRNALLEGNSEWLEHLRTAFGPPNNLTNWRFNKPFLDWCQASPKDAQSALHVIWDENRTVSKRFNNFVTAISDDLDHVTVAEASFLHMAMDPLTFPVFRATPVSKGYKLTGYPDPHAWSNANPGGRYEHFLDFLDELLAQASSAGIDLRDRLDAQSIVWSISRQPLPPDATDEEQAEFNRYKTPSAAALVGEREALGTEIEPDHDGHSNGSPQEPAKHANRTESSSRLINYVEPSFSDIVAFVRDQGLRISQRTLRRYHLSLSTRGFVILAGVSGTGKTWLAEAYAAAVSAEHILVSVAPNWTTNEDLLGYYNPVTERFHDTPFSHFIRKAAKAHQLAAIQGLQPQPFHLILDEMNLARVEYYFASFLSAMEVRARHGTATMNIGDGDKLQLTPNLFVIGTVNIDETTHGFADKVWDRAQLVELDLPREQMAAHLSGTPYQEDILAIWDTVRAVGPFAYRVVDDINDYVSEAEAIGVSWEESLDEQILQKILPKLKGTRPDIEVALERLTEILEDRYPLSHERTHVMLEGIRNYGFASYFA